MKADPKILWAVVALLVLGGVAYVIFQNGIGRNASTQYGLLKPPSQGTAGGLEPKEGSGGATAGGAGAPPSEIPAPSTPTNAYIKGAVVSIDLAGKRLSYKPYAFGVLATTAATATFASTTPVYSVASEAQIATANSGTTRTLADIKSGQTIFIQVDGATPPGKSIAPLAFIVVEK